MRRSVFSLLFLLFLNLVLSGLANPSLAAEAYPSQPVKLTVTYGKGGAADIAARLFAAIAPEYLGQPISVGAVIGNAGIKGMSTVHKSSPDGYTLALARIGSITGSAAVRTNLPYAYDDFTMLGLLEINPTVLTVSSNSPYTHVTQLLAAIKNKPGTLKYAIPGRYNLQHLSALLLMDKGGVANPATDAKAALFSGGGAGIKAVADGKVDFSIGNLSSAMNLVRKGAVRPLLINTPSRHSFLPNTMTAREAGLADLESVVGWSAIFGPPGMSKDLVQKWSGVMQQVKNNRTWNNLVKATGSIASIQSPDGTRMFVNAQYKVLHALAKRLKLRK
jgi:tripartite-type tricarboxylate transporter receptor subunit TctC